MPVDIGALSCLYVTLAQRGMVLTEKCLEDCSYDGAVVTCKLTQKDTLAINPVHPVELQVRAKTVEGDVLASQIATVPAYRILKDGEI